MIWGPENGGPLDGFRQISNVQLWRNVSPSARLVVDHCAEAIMARRPKTTGLEEVTYGDQTLRRGQGGETHQIAEDGYDVLTAQQGIPVADDQNSLKQGARGPTLIEDAHFREKIFHFDHERIPERVVHARGYGAHGFFETYKSLSKVTRADIFQREGEQTPVFVRFSTVAGSKGSFDLARDVRGFAVKFYTREGNWDLVGNNIPVFFIQDAIKFPDIIHSVKPEPDKAFPRRKARMTISGTSFPSPLNPCT